MSYVYANQPHHSNIMLFTSVIFWLCPTTCTKGSYWEVQEQSHRRYLGCSHCLGGKPVSQNCHIPISYLRLQHLHQKLPKKRLVLPFNSRWVISQGLVTYTFTIPLKTVFILPLVFVFCCRLPFSLLSATPFLIYDIKEQGSTPFGSCLFFPVHLISLWNVTFFSLYFYGRLKPPHWSPNTADGVEIWTQALWIESISLMVQTKCPDLAEIQKSKQEQWSHKASARTVPQGGEQAILLPRSCSHIQS